MNILKTWLSTVLGHARNPKPLDPIPASPIPASPIPVSTIGSPITGHRGTKGIQSRAWRNRNPGNMRPRATALPVDHIAVDRDPGGPFGIYASERDGWADLAARIIQLHRNGTNTVSSIISVWAPPSENNTNVYIAGVAAALKVSPTQPVDPRPLATMAILADAIRRHEGLGSDPSWDRDQFTAGLRLGGCI